MYSQEYVSETNPELLPLRKKVNVWPVMGSPDIINLEFIKLSETLNADLCVQHMLRVHKSLIEMQLRWEI